METGNRLPAFDPFENARTQRGVATCRVGRSDAYTPSRSSTTLATLEAGSDTRVVLRRGSLPAGLASRALVTWQVVAMSRNDTLAASRATPVRLP